MLRRRCWLPVLIASVVWVGSVRAQGVERNEEGEVDAAVYIMAYGGVSQMTGHVERIANVGIGSTSAGDVYKRSPHYGMLFGGHVDRLMIELCVEGGQLFLTNGAKDQLQAVLESEDDISSYYVSYEYTMGVVYPLTRNIVAYSAGSISALEHVLTPEGGDPTNDWGFGTALKTGLNLYTAREDFVIRAGVRYQALELGVDVPHVVTYMIGVGSCLSH